MVVAVARGIFVALDSGQEKYLEADAESYFADPARALSAAGSDTPLGSGLELLGPGLTVVALFLAEKAVDVVADKTVDSILDKLKSRRRKALPAPPELTAAQTEEIRRSVIAAAGKQGLDPTTADDLALAVVEQLSGRAD
ncbi:hypothetical protein BJ973_000577 [Actinoplanes tereljensis]|uniref:hypothetical protein n=1 Tax=Paractinoplanes tereljensis TaxID=571912 RepID=UPI00194197B5|nr:hypothetical protein [Actinoplanes tereljensis]